MRPRRVRRGTTVGMRVLGLAVAVLASLAVAAPASAATLGRFGSTLVYEGEPGEANDLTVAFDGSSYVFTERTLTIVTGCNGAPQIGTTVSCLGAGVINLRFDLGDQDDALDVESSIVVPITALGGPGADRMNGGEDFDTLTGGDGATRWWATGVATSSTATPGGTSCSAAAATTSCAAGTTPTV